MEKRIQTTLANCRAKSHHVYRKEFPSNKIHEFQDVNLSYYKRIEKRLSLIFAEETPIVQENQNIVFQRTVSVVPDVYTDAEMSEIRKKHFVHERGNVSNLCPDYAPVIKNGLDSILTQIEGKDNEFYNTVRNEIYSVYALCDKYKEKAKEVGNQAIYKILSNIPGKGATSFNEALQFFRILHFTVWAEGEYHVIVGRFDQFMYPYLKNDIDNGILTKEKALELLEEFFISFNLDSDLYPGMQQGDDGQSIVLGGTDENGNDVYNLLSELCITACGELRLIDPKINLRVSHKTPDERYAFATKLTQKGLGFPQYSNDDVVIDGLKALNYESKDAGNYVVAACWEFIIPGCGMEIVNIAAVSFPKAVHDAINESLLTSDNFTDFMLCVKNNIQKQINQICNRVKSLFILPAPFMSIMMTDCIKNGTDISQGSKYNNYGIHGIGIATAADSLINIKNDIFENKLFTKEALIDALSKDFKGYDDMRALLRFSENKMGNDIDEVDQFACELLNCFADSLKSKKNERGGCYRAGTGTAMFYLHKGDDFATADGKNAAEPFGTNFSPSLFVRNKGPLSTIKSFTKPDLKNTINGGPLTMEFNLNSLATEENVYSIAMLVKCFIERGGHQLQLNVVDNDTLKRAQIEPEKYPDLIVRVWGWSAYFCELSKEYQDQIIRRQEF